VRVEDFMTRGVLTIAPDATILAAAKLMLEHHVGALPVVDASARIVGIISESDLLRDDGKSDDGKGADGSPWLQMMAEPDGLPGEPSKLCARQISAVMTRALVSIAPNASIAQACRLMQQRRVKRLPVVENERLVGLITRTDLLRAFAQSIEKSAPPPVPDVSVDSRLAELERQIWRSRARVIRPF
jgi:CBS domain-containing protein